MRSAAAVLVLSVLAACDRGDAAGGLRADGSLLYNSSGEVALSDGGSLPFSMTSERYKQWDAARRGLDRRMAARFGALLQPHSPSERSINRAVEYLQREPRARQAIERAGMSVRDFVVMTVALEQEMRLASERGDRPPEPMPVPYPPTDSPYVPAYPTYPAYPAYPNPATPPVPSQPRADSVPRIDTVFVASPPPSPTPTPAPLPTGRDTTVKRDTLSLSKPVPPRDTARAMRDTTKVRRDTTPIIRDTLPRT